MNSGCRPGVVKWGFARDALNNDVTVLSEIFTHLVRDHHEAGAYRLTESIQQSGAGIEQNCGNLLRKASRQDAITAQNAVAVCEQRDNRIYLSGLLNIFSDMLNYEPD